MIYLSLHFYKLVFCLTRLDATSAKVLWKPRLAKFKSLYLKKKKGGLYFTSVIIGIL